MRNWIRWFRGLNGPSKYTIVGTLLSAVGVLIGIVGLKPDWFGIGSTARPTGEPAAHAAAHQTKPTSSSDASVSPSAKQSAQGNNNLQIGNARDVLVNQKPTMRKKQVLQNAGSNVALVMKEIDEDPQMIVKYADDPRKLGFVPVGTEIKILDEKRKSTKFSVFASYTRIEILEGEYKGKSGWAEVSNTSTIEVSE